MSFSKQDYVTRISTASPLQLVIITYELAIEYIKESKENINTKDFDLKIEKARKCILELSNSLNLSYKISTSLLSLYIYLDKTLSKYLFKKDLSLADECIKILSNLLEGFTGICHLEADTSSVMENSQKIYAGLTYSKDGNLDEFVAESNNRGFKV